MPRRRLRSFTLWTGTLLCVLIAAAFVLSGWWVLAVQAPTRYGPGVAVDGGAFGGVLDYRWWEPLVAEPRRTAQAPLLGGWQPIWQWWNFWGASGRYIFVPLYAMFLAVLLPTLLVWRFWPKAVKPGHCRCGYDLTGNVSRECPECGKAV